MNSIQPISYPNVVSPGVEAVGAARKAKVGWGFLEFFVISQTAFPAILYLPGTQPLRLPLRVASFAIGLGALVWWLNKNRRSIPLHPGGFLLALASAWTGLMILHPNTNTLASGLAQTMLYLAVMSPVFWVPPLIRNTQQVKRLLIILLGCNAINSLVGVLQAYFPKTFLPREFAYFFEDSAYGVSHLSFINSAGEIIVRPPGLYDTPGAVFVAGMFTALLGTVFFLGKFAKWQRLLAGGIALIGAAAVFLSHVRSALLITAGMMIVYTGVLFFVQRQRAKAMVFIGVATLALVVMFSYSITVGGQATAERITSLFQEDPLKTYNDARGRMVVDGFSVYLPRYPLGAGLGRWGQIYVYFGDKTNVNSPFIWAEIQLPAWILDGGIVLLVLYCAALVMTTFYQLKIARKATDPDLKFCAPLIVAANIGVATLIFSWVPFAAQIGVQYWFLAGALHGAWQINKAAARAGKQLTQPQATPLPAAQPVYPNF